MDDDVETVPLPEAMSQCGCPHAPRLHVTTCATAIALDDTPLDQREGYVWDEATSRSNRFEGFSWEYPVHIEGSFRIDVRLDPVAIIKDHLDQYRAYEMEDGGYQDWEKPIQFLLHLIEEQVDFGGVYFGKRRHSMDSSDLEELFETQRPRWTPEDTERLEAQLTEEPSSPVVDPNQGSLDV